jgi:ubiquinone/menaquinone biosynthesis C-methylase UbiE
MAAKLPRVDAPASNTEWIAWGKYDPLYGVSSYADRHKNGSEPWTEEAFYAFGAEVWPHLRKIWANYGLKKGACIEIGCGAGRITRQLASEFEKVYALDVSEGMLSIASRNVRSENVQFCLNNGQEIDLADGVAEAAFSTDVFQHFSDRGIADRYFAELSRVMAPGGTFMIHLPVYKWPSNARLFSRVYSVLRGLQETKYRVKRMAVNWNLMNPFMVAYRYDIAWLFERLDLHGFEEIEMRIVAPAISRRKNAMKPYLFATRKDVANETLNA